MRALVRVGAEVACDRLRGLEQLPVAVIAKLLVSFSPSIVSGGWEGAVDGSTYAHVPMGHWYFFVNWQ